MSKFNDLKKQYFINGADKYSEGKENKMSAKISERVTFTMDKNYKDILYEIAQKDRLSKSQIIRASILRFSRCSKEEKEEIYKEIY